MVRIERRGLFSARRPRIPDELDAHSAHTKHDHRRYEPGEDRAADHQSVGQRLADAMRHHDRTRAGRKMREDEERAEPIMRHEADVPRILDESGGRARREAPSGVDAKICPCENEDRVHVAKHIKGDARYRFSTLGTDTIFPRRCGRPASISWAMRASSSGSTVPTCVTSFPLSNSSVILFSRAVVTST